MNKRDLLFGALAGITASIPAQSVARRVTPLQGGPTLLIVSGRIGAGNRGALDPALDQLMAKQGVAFKSAHAFDSTALSALPAVSIKPTLEYDRKQHTLTGPLLADVLAAAGAKINKTSSFRVRAIDGYAVELAATDVLDRRFMVATHLDGQIMGLGGLGPCWVVYNADQFPDMAARPLNERFALCPWAAYHIDVLPT